MYQKSFVNNTCEDCKSAKKSVFCELNTEDLGILTLSKNCNLYKKGQIVFFEGNYPDGLFCLREGKIKIYKTGPEGKEQIIRLAKTGDVLGYRALISGEHYNATAATLEDSRVCFIRKEAIFNLLKTNSNFSLYLIKLLSKDLEDVENRLVNITQKPVRERLAEALIILKETYGTESNNSVLNISLSREDLANIVGTATETVIRLLADFRQNGLISTKGKKIEILSLEGLIKAGNIKDV